ncbi:hypothetical protein ACA910_010643 [Epithemia clementina (nom. ined.)]
MHTTSTNFCALSTKISNQITQLAQDFCKATSITLLTNYPTPKVFFKNQPYDNSLGSSLNSYLLACLSLYSINSSNGLISHTTTPVYNSGPAPQAWSSPVPVPTIVKAPTTTTTPTPISQEHFNCVTSDIISMMHKLQELHNQVSGLVTTQQQTLRSLPQQIDYSCIVLSVIETLIHKNLLQAPLPANLPPQLAQASPTTYEAAQPLTLQMDVSFAANLNQIDHDEDHE